MPLAAQATTGFGAASFTTVRDCSTTANTANCDGTGAGQQIRQSQTVGGVNQQVSTSFTSAAPYAGSSTTTAISFGDFGLPTVSGTVVASPTTRVGNNYFFFQSYRYDGPAAADFALVGNLHIVDSSGNASGQSLPGGAIAAARLNVWNATDWATFNSAADMVSGPFSYQFSSGCGAGQGGPLSAVGTTVALTGGERNIGLSLGDSCNGNGLIRLNPGDEFVVAGSMQLIANRGGWIDASQTFTVALDPTLGAATIAALQSGLSPASLAAVPEPASWAMMMLGFGAMGAALRRRAKVAARIRFA